jgi:hypothetical protein
VHNSKKVPLEGDRIKTDKKKKLDKYLKNKPIKISAANETNSNRKQWNLEISSAQTLRHIR